MIFCLFVDSSFNLYTGRHFIFRVLQVIETAPCTGTSIGQVQMLFQQIQDVIYQRKLPCFVAHIRAHSSIPGPLMNCDELTWMAILSKVELAQQSHAFHHQKSTS